MTAEPVRRAEIVAALSLATDLAIGQPLEFALKSCVLGMRIGEALDLSPEELRQIYFQALLRYIGCNADTYLLSALVGDEMAFRREVARADLADDLEMLTLLARAARRVTEGEGLVAMVVAVLRAMAMGRAVSTPVLSGHCEVASRLAERLSLGSAIARNLGQLYERWDGKGLPSGLRGEAISPAVRVVSLAQDAIVLREAYGWEDACRQIGSRRGKAYDPRLADLILARGDDLFRGLDMAATMEAVLGLEPEPHAWIAAEELDQACTVIADFVDMRTPFTIGHSRAVSELAAAAARHCGLPPHDSTLLRRAGLVHDLGELSIPTSVWMSPGPMRHRDGEQIRLHPYFTERILTGPAPLAEAAALAGRHHERLDGSGYFRGARGQALSLPASILAAAEAYQTKIEARPHRASLSPGAAAQALRGEAREGRLDGRAVEAVLAAAGRPGRATPRARTDGLTAREIEVLRHLCQGKTLRQLAGDLGISPKTADNHVQSLYSKVGVSTRAGAVLFAVEQGLTAGA